jgi:hypothetical protein
MLLNSYSRVLMITKIAENNCFVQRSGYPWCILDFFYENGNPDFPVSDTIPFYLS